MDRYGSSQFDYINIFPNPVHYILSLLNLDNLGQFEIFILDIGGKVMLKSNNRSEIDVSTLTPGVYFCKLKNKNESRVYIFLKY